MLAGPTAIEPNRTDVLRAFQKVFDLPADLDPGARDALRIAQIDYLVKQSPMMAVVSLINVALTVFLFQGLCSGPFLIGWAGLASFLSVYQLQRWYKVRNRPLPLRPSKRAIPRAILWAVLLGSVWGFFALVAFPTADPGLQTFLAFVIGGMAAGAVATLSPIPSVCVAYILPAITPLVIRFSAMDGTVSMTMAAILVIFASALIYAAMKGHSQFASVVRMQRELAGVREDLLDAINSTSEAFALFGDDGKAIVRNSRYSEYFGEDDTPPAPSSEGEWEHRMADGRWLQSSVRLTERGGYVSVHADITHLKRREAELKKARDEATSASRAKTEFLALMSHELRTPLNAILGFSQILKSPEMVQSFGDKICDYAADIHNSGETLLQMINDILDLSKIEAGLYRLSEESFAVCEAVETAVGREYIAAEEAAVTVHIDRESLPHLIADERCVTQMVGNLLSNAIKFTPAGGEVRIFGEIENDAAIIAIRDTGIGIAAQDMDRVFEPFRQVEGSLARMKEGKGLGVPLVTRLMKLHGGTLTLDSIVGEGTTARLRFPRSRLAEGRAAQRSANAASA